MQTGRPAWVEVDLAAIRHNVSQVREFIGPRCAVLAVAKANAYGHGLVEVSQVCLEAGAAGLGVALLTEAVALRDAGIGAPVLVLGAPLDSEAADLVAHDITVLVDSRAQGEALSAAAARLGKVARVHVKVDTGMGRRGAVPDDVPELLQHLLALPYLAVEAIATHFATADEPDAAFALQQLAEFDRCLSQARALCGSPLLGHAANSAATLRLPAAHHDMVRPGLLVYGVPPYPGSERVVALRPAMRLVSRIVSVRDMPAGTPVGYGCTYRMEHAGRVAIVPLGYADGFSRRNSNTGDVLLRGRRVPIRGRICMDQFMVDVTDLPEARVGDEVVLLGRDGGEEITVQEIADRTGTITHETLAALTCRLPRRYGG